MTLDLRHVALASWLLAWCGPIAAYLLSAAEGYVPWCVPHLTGCDSVSATGRHGWGFFVFKAALLPAAGFLFVYWALCYEWLTRLAPEEKHGVVLALGWIGTLFLVLYVTFLGSEGDVYRQMRRYGTVVYFGGTYLAQLLMAKRLQAVGAPLAQWKLRLAVYMLIGGLVFAGAANFFEDDDFIQNISEWNFGSALTIFPLLTWLGWRRSGFLVRFTLAPTKH